MSRLGVDVVVHLPLSFHDPHIVCVNRLNTIFSRRLVTHEIEGVVVSVQNPVRIDEHNEPEPDVVLSTALDGAPRPDDVMLLERYPAVPWITTAT